jgi:hypothetical protein
MIYFSSLFLFVYASATAAVGAGGLSATATATAAAAATFFEKNGVADTDARRTAHALDAALMSLAVTDDGGLRRSRSLSSLASLLHATRDASSLVAGPQLESDLTLGVYTRHAHTPKTPSSSSAFFSGTAALSSSTTTAAVVTPTSAAAAASEGIIGALSPSRGRHGRSASTSDTFSAVGALTVTLPPLLSHPVSHTAPPTAEISSHADVVSNATAAAAAVATVTPLPPACEAVLAQLAVHGAAWHRQLADLHADVQAAAASHAQVPHFVYAFCLCFFIQFIHVIHFIFYPPPPPFAPGPRSRAPWSQSRRWCRT